jgi:hypothetical protein
VLHTISFDPKWCEWIDRLVSQASVGIKVNDDMGHYFQTHKVLRQGYSFSSLLFYLVANMIAILTAKVKEDEKVDYLISI